MRVKSFAFKTILVFVILIFISIFSLTGIYISYREHMITEIMEDNLSKLVQEKKMALELRLRQVEIVTRELGIWSKKYLEEEYEDDKDFSKKYFRNKDYILCNTKNDSKTSIFLNKNVKLTDNIKNQIIATEKMEEHFIRTLETNRDIVCTYIITSDGLLRVYPYMDNSSINPEHDFTKDMYYQIAAKENNPKGSMVWTKPYNDWAGRGWVITCAYPIYIKNHLEAVVFTDVTLKFFQEAIEDFQVANSGFAFLLDKDGNIIYHPKYIPKPSKRGEILYRNLLLESNNQAFKKIIRQMIQGQRGQQFYYNNQTKTNHLISYTPISKLAWSIGLDVNENEYKINFKKYSGIYVLFSILIIGVTLGLGIYFLKGISKPIVTLSKNAEKIASGNFKEIIDIKSHDEIGSIAESLNTMNSKIKEYMKSLIKSEKQLQTVFNSIRGFLSIRSLDYRILMVNNSGKNLAKKKKKDIMNSICYEYFMNRSEPCPGCPMVKTIQTGQEAFSEMVFDDRIFHIWSFPVHNHDNQITEVVVYSIEVTEKIVLEKEFHQKEKLAGIGQMAAGVTHELKNPLAVIKGNIYLLRHTVNELQVNQSILDELYENLDEIDHSVERAEQIIYNLLDFSRRSIANKERIDISSLMEQILILKKKNIIENNIEIVTDFGKRPLEVYASLDSMKHIFLNLIDNAIQAMPDGGYLKIYGAQMEAEGKVKIHITDTGVGISKKLQDKVFQPFFTTKPKGEGTGIGLWIVKNEIKKNLGEIQLTSEEGKGTRISIFLPMGKLCEGE